MIDKAKVVELYKNGSSLPGIVEVFGVTVRQILDILREEGYEN